MSRRRNKYYDRKLKLQAVQDYLGGGGSLRTIGKKHGIKDKKQLRNWIKWYNGHKEIKERRAAGTEIYMTKGRKTTEKERAEIVAFCIEHGKNYPLTIKTYGVSYQQIYAWVRKYEEKGVAGLVVPFPVSWTVKMKKKQKETQDILSYHSQAAGCSDKARAKASGGRQPIEECGRTGL